MVEILHYLAKYCGFLFGPNGYHIVGSSVSEGSSGDAAVVLESEVLRLQFSRDRGQLLFMCQPIDTSLGKPHEWYSQGLLRGLLMGERGGTEVLDEQWALFLESALPDLERRLRNRVKRRQLSKS